MPKVSVIIPAYNAAAYIRKAVVSALEQTLTDIEILVVDDGSGDDTSAIVERVAAEDSRVRLHRFPTNRGVSTARNAAIDQARGEWVALLDADDAFAPDRLDRMIAAATAAGVDQVADNHTTVREGASVAYTIFPLRGPESFFVTALDFARSAEFGKSGTMAALQPVFRKSVLDKHGLRYREDMVAGEDYNFQMRCLAVMGGILVLRAPGYIRHLRQGSQRTVWNEEHFRMLQRSLKELIEIFRNDPAMCDLLVKRQQQLKRLARVLAIFVPARRLHMAVAARAAVRDIGILPNFLWYGFSLASYRLRMKLIARRGGSDLASLPPERELAAR